MGGVVCIRDEEGERVAAMVGRFDVGWMGFKLRSSRLVALRVGLQ